MEKVGRREWDFKSFGIIHLFGYRSSEGSVGQRNILSSTKLRKRRTELRTELSGKRDGDGENF